MLNLQWPVHIRRDRLGHRETMGGNPAPTAIGADDTPWCEDVSMLGSLFDLTHVPASQLRDLRAVTSFSGLVCQFVKVRWLMVDPANSSVLPSCSLTSCTGACSTTGCVLQGFCVLYC